MAGLPRLRVWSLYPGTKVDTVCVMYVEHVFVVGVCQSPSNFDCSQLPGGGEQGGLFSAEKVCRYTIIPK